MKIEDFNLNEFHRQNEIADRIYDLRKKEILPIVKDGKLMIYKVNVTYSIGKLQKYLKDNFVETYSSVILSKKLREERLEGASYSPILKDMINYHQASKEEFITYFNLNDEVNQNEFTDENAQDVEVTVPIDDTFFGKVYRKETFEEILDRLVPNYVTCTYERKSKLLVLLNYIQYGKYFNLDFIANMLNEFLTNRKDKLHFNYTEDVNTIEVKEDAIEEMNFNDKEKSLSEEEKINILKEIFASLDIECIYSNDIDKISNIEIAGIINSSDSNFKDPFIKFAMHNTDILENSEVAHVFNKIMENNTLKKVKK